MPKAWIIALAAIGVALVLGRYALHERDQARAARLEAQTLRTAADALKAGRKEAERGAAEREIRYVEVIREVAAAGPVSAECREDPALRAAADGMQRMRADYCRTTGRC